jgi:hypothetical protein
MKIENCAVNGRDRRIIVPPTSIPPELKEGMSIAGAPIPAGAKVLEIGHDWIEISEDPTMTWFGDLDAA